MKIKQLNRDNCTYYSPTEFRRRQWRRGLPLSLVGCFVYVFLRLIGKKPKDFYGICPYFEIGEWWGGFAMGWFFVSDKNLSDESRAHEVGHGMVNANIGGFRMIWYSIGSAIRYWWREIRKSNVDYDSWWFENQATQIGQEYLRQVRNTNTN